MTNSKSILITGAPGVGKTTLIQRVADRLDDVRVTGFYTAEIRDGGRRVGFEAVSLDQAHRVVLAHVDIKSDTRVSKYGVDVSSFEKFLDDVRLTDSKDADVVIIDEIGKMECYSQKFVDLITGLLDSRTPVVATVAQKGGGVIAAIKKRDDVEVLTVTRDNRDRLYKDVIERIRRRMQS